VHSKENRPDINIPMHAHVYTCIYVRVYIHIYIYIYIYIHIHIKSHEWILRGTRDHVAEWKSGDAVAREKGDGGERRGEQRVGGWAGGREGEGIYARTERHDDWTGGLQRASSIFP